MWNKLFGRKKEQRETVPVTASDSRAIVAYVSGTIIPIEECGEEMFAQKALGDGIVIVPADGIVAAPYDCEVVMAFATGHAFGLRSTSGVECMLHLGIDTVHIDERVFKPLVVEGDKIKAGTVLAYADLEAIRRHGKNTSMLCILTNGDKWRILHREVNGSVSVGKDIIMTFEKL